jgi:hypothetical protein
MGKGFDVSPAVRQGVKDRALEIVSNAGGPQAVIESVVRAIEWLEGAPTVAAASRMSKAELLEVYRHAIGAAEELYRATIVLNATTLDGGTARTETGANNASARWARLDPVKEWSFQQRRDNPQESRASVIKTILPDVRQRAKAQGVALTGDDATVARTVTGWFRKAGIS